MKKRLARVLSLVICFALLIGMVQGVFVQAETNQTPVATNVTGMTLSFAENYRGSTLYGPAWVITVQTDQDIAFNSKSNYWLINSQQIMVDKQASGLVENDEIIMTVDEHNALREELLEKVIINGQNLGYWLDLDGNALSARVDLTNNSGANCFVVELRAEYVTTKDNVAGVNDYTDFSIGFAEDLVINNCKITPTTWRYHAETKGFTKASENTSVLSQSLALDDDNFVYTFKTYDDISGDAALTSLVSNIKINDVVVGNDVVITAGTTANKDEANLYIKVPKTNSYGLNDLNSRSIISFDNLSVNGVTIASNSFRWSSTEQELISGNTDVYEIKPTEMSYTHSHSTITGSHNGVFRVLWANYCAVYAITLEADTAFDSADYDFEFSGRSGTTYLSSYSNADAGKLDYAYTYGTEASANHDALAKMLKENIFINGTSIAEAHVDNVDYTSQSVLVGINGNKITVMVPVGFFNSTEDRTNANKLFNNASHGFNIGGYGSLSTAVDYTVEIGDGIDIGGVKLAPAKYQFTATNNSNADAGDFTLISRDTDDTASIINVNTVANTNSKYTSGNKGGFTVVTIGTDRKLYESAALENDNGKYYTARLNQKNTAYTFESTSNYNDFQEKILINGKSLATYMLNSAQTNLSAGASLASDWDTWLGVGASFAAVTSHELYLSLPVTQFSVNSSKGTRYFGSETYGYDLTNGFTVTILPGLELNGHELQAGEITVTANGDGTYSSTFVANDDIPYYPSASIASMSSAKLDNGKYGGSSHQSHTPASEHWVINLYYGTSLKATAAVLGCGEGDVNYYNRELQSAPALKDTVLNGISITTKDENGNTVVKTLAECMAEESEYERTGDIMLNGSTRDGARTGDRAFHVGLWDESIEICIPKDNCFGFNGDEEFTVKVGQMSLGQTIATSSASFDPSTNSFNVTNEPYVESGSAVVLTQNSKGEYWEIRIPSTNEKSAAVISDLPNDLQFVERQSTEELKNIGNEIINNITINGETLAESISREDSHYTARVSTSGKEIIISIMRKTPSTYDNAFYISDETDFTVGIKNDIVIGKAIFANDVYTYDSANKVFTANGSYDASKEHERYTKSILNITGTDTAMNELLGGECGIKIYTGGAYYVDFMLDANVRYETLGLPKPIYDKKDGYRWATYWVNKHGQTVMNNIILDGLSVGAWIEKGFGDIYGLMIQFEDNHIRILSNGAASSPTLSPKEWHWIEFKEGLVSQCSYDENGDWIDSNEYISASMWVYNPVTLKWTELSTIANGEYKTFEEAAAAGVIGYPEYLLNLSEAKDFISNDKDVDDEYVRSTTDGEETADITTSGNDTNVQSPSDTVTNDTDKKDDTVTDDNLSVNNSGTSTESEKQETTEGDSDEPDEQKKQTVTKKKKVKGDVIYETYIPTGAIIAIVIGAVVLAGGIILIIFKKKKRR